MDLTELKARQSYAAWLKRLSDWLNGHCFPDPRTPEQRNQERDEAIEREWRNRVAANQASRKAACASSHRT